MRRQDDRHRMVTLTLVSGVIRVVEERKSGACGGRGEEGNGAAAHIEILENVSRFNQEDP